MDLKFLAPASKALLSLMDLDHKFGFKNEGATVQKNNEKRDNA